MRRLAAFVCALALVGPGGCRTSDPTTGPQYFSLVFNDFAAAAPLDVTTPMTLVFRDQATWDAFWQAHAPLAGSAPVHDFSREMLIGVFWGAQGTGCVEFVNSIRSVRARIDGVNMLGTIEVDIGPLPPLGSCATPINPLQVVTVEATITPVEFVGLVPS
ncbi:MAG: hypothetical protein GTO30_04060 [Acidobacteria bacterium]|nr:hypothetical protein [Acidobacteriota bacterium]NIQ84469.1 hypothetical protein [Acidobacteriota bacterium]